MAIVFRCIDKTARIYAGEATAKVGRRFLDLSFRIDGRADKYRIDGRADKYRIDGRADICEACGKRNLKYVVALETQGEVVRYGTDCASVALRYGTKVDRKAADRVWFRALQQNRVQKGIELGLRVRAEVEANPVTIRDLKRDLDEEATSPGYFCFQAPNGAVVYVLKGQHTRNDCTNELGETLKETALRLYPGALLRARVLEISPMLDRGLDEGAAYRALTT